ncbi:hypothetical protein BH09MYX1_BH09MYX1_05040 [soil metagenome]
MALPVPWLVDFAVRAGLRYEPEADERWIRVWEPYATLKTPIRYDHALHGTGTSNALTIARMVLTPRPGFAASDEAWIAIGQDERLRGNAAASSDAGPLFRDDAVALPRQRTGDPAFDSVFTSYGQSEAEVREIISPSLRKLTLGWRAPVHFELRAGGFILVPVALKPEPPSLAWLVEASRVFAEKAAKRG